MKTSKTKLRIKLLKAFSAVLFFSFLLTGVIFNFAVRFATDADAAYPINPYYYFTEEAARFAGRAAIILFILVSVMFIMALIITYFLANSITRPIEKLGAFALDIGNGNFTPNNFEFREKELEDLNAALNKSAKQLSIYDSEQKMFFQNASHELRTPLMSIKCYAEGITFGIMDPKTASETILSETDKLAELVTDLLYIAKIDNITTVYTAIETDLHELVKTCVSRQEALAAKQQIKFAFNFGQTPIHYKCVNELLSRAIDNLISNAIRYASSTITLTCHKTASYIEIHVADDGNGLDPNIMPHIFERFYKGPDGNTGIGLSIVKSIVEQHSGNIVAKNNNNGGAAFIIILPILAP